MVKRMALVLTMLMVAGGFIFANAQQETPAPSTDGSGSYVIGLSNYSLGNSWRVQMMEEARFEAKNNPRIKELITTEANDDTAKQIADIEDLIARGVDAICISASNPKALIPVVEKAMAAGIVVVDFDNVVDTDNITAHVIVDQIDFGKVQAEWLVKTMNGKGNVVAFNGIKGTSVSADRYAGALSILDMYPEIKIINVVYADWDFAKAKRAMENIIASNAQIDGVWSQGGAMSEAVVKAYNERGLKIPPVTGEDGNGFLKAWKKLREEGSTFDSIATSMPTWISKKAMQVAIDALDGKQVQKEIVLPIPTITADTLDNYVRPNLSDSFWCNSQLPDDRVKAIFQN
ncbi:MAG: ABC transporter substrate-binding protein [Chitinispirillaceae bacterium]|nr:ABC transporter substrate-binding protein [Chitinispirillaceae bacterium]